MVTISWWEFLLAIATIISLFFNWVQYRQSRKGIKPSRDSLIGLFNDIKSKALLSYNKMQLLYHPQNPHKELETLRWDFNDFCYFMLQTMQGFQEHVVATLKALDVDEKEVFKASDFGLTKEEKEIRDEWMTKYRKDQKKIVPPALPAE